MDEPTPDTHRAYPGRNTNGRFQKGMSGNKRGRPRKAHSTKSVMQAMFSSKVTATVDGRIVNMTVVEAIAARVKREALTGPLRGLETAMTMAQRYSPEDPPPPEPGWNLNWLDDEELEHFHVLLAKVYGEALDEAQNPRLIELDPHYCDLIMRRFEDITGSQVRLSEPGG